MAQRGKKPSQFPGDFIALGSKPGKFQRTLIKCRMIDIIHK